ncbi:MAG: hypothetical protein ACHBN1_17620 [Heteroscytonema crispum UTEX LB 1556]
MVLIRVNYKERNPTPYPSIASVAFRAIAAYKQRFDIEKRI